jgi:hypothetical protein
MLVGVDDEMLTVAEPLHEEGLSNGQRRAAIREANLDHHPRPFGNEQVSKDIAVVVGQSHRSKSPSDRARAGPTSASLRRAERTALRCSEFTGI